MSLSPGIRALAADLKARFETAGAVAVECPILVSAETLLDLYGEGIRARAYVTPDPNRGEVMLRPDFTVPIVQMHMRDGAEPARYTYAGEVFRRQEDFPDRPSEYLQVGYEVFDRTAPEKADAEVFATLHDAVGAIPVTATTGDIGLLMAAVRGLRTTDRRKAALMRHIWRPRRFRALLDRFSGKTPVPPSRAALLAARDPFAKAGPDIGLRSRSDVADRIDALRADAADPKLGQGEVALIDALLAVRESCDYALEQIRDLAVDLPAIQGATDTLAQRINALADRGMDVSDILFDAGYGRANMEYYDGFVFGLSASKRPDLPELVTGGRYDALTRQLGAGRSIPAVGGVVRPHLLALATQGATA